MKEQILILRVLKILILARYISLILKEIDKQRKSVLLQVLPVMGIAILKLHKEEQLFLRGLGVSVDNNWANILYKVNLVKLMICSNLLT